MGHISHDAGFRKVFGTTLRLVVEKSSDQARVALRWFGKGHDPRQFGQSEGKQLITLRVSWARFTTLNPFKKYGKRPSFTVSAYWGMGAGYIGGATAFFGFNVKGGRVNYQKYPLAAYKVARFRLGATRNGNAIPYPNW